MTRLEQKEKSIELIGFLSAFDISYRDARTILYMGFEGIRSMNDETYRKTGDGMRTIALAMKPEGNA